MGQQSFEFKANKPDGIPFGWNSRLKYFFDGLAISDRMGKAVVTRDRFGNRNSISDDSTLKEFLCALMRIEKPKLKVQDSVPNHTKTEMARFNDSCMHRADRHFTDPLAFDL